MPVSSYWCLPFRILSISRRKDAPVELAPPRHLEELDASTGVLGSLMENVTCSFYSDMDGTEQYYDVMFTYQKYGLKRRTRVCLWSDSEEGGKKTVVGWYENPTRGRRLTEVTPHEIFPGHKEGDLFVNWLEYPELCQIWRFRATSWSPFEMGGWQSVAWGFEHDENHLVMLPDNEKCAPAFVPKEVYLKSYKHQVPIIIT